MQKNKILDLIYKKFPRTKKLKFNNKEDLVKESILDSLEIMTLISIIEKKFSFNLKKFAKNKNKKITIQNLSDFSNNI